MTRRARSVCMPELALKACDACPDASTTPRAWPAGSGSSRSRHDLAPQSAPCSASSSWLLGGSVWWVGLLNLVFAAIFVAVPLLYRFGEIDRTADVLRAPRISSVGFICYTIGTGSGLQFYFLVSATLVLLVFGIERIVLASRSSRSASLATIALELLVPNDRGLGPPWMLDRRLRQLRRSDPRSS